MSDTSRQDKIHDPSEFYISTKVYLRLVIAYFLVFHVTNLVADGIGEFSYASAFIALTFVLGGVYIGCLSLRGREVGMPLWFIVMMVSCGVVFVFNARAIISFILGKF